MKKGSNAPKMPTKPSMPRGRRMPIRYITCLMVRSGLHMLSRFVMARSSSLPPIGLFRYRGNHLLAGSLPMDLFRMRIQKSAILPSLALFICRPIGVRRVDLMRAESAITCR